MGTAWTYSKDVAQDHVAIRTKAGLMDVSGLKKLHLVARRDLTETMSAYLVERIASLSNVELHVGCELAGLQREPGGMLSATFRSRNGGANLEPGLRQVFLFIGADPNTAWLGGCVDVEKRAAG